MANSPNRTKLPDKIVLNFQSFGRINFSYLEEVSEFLGDETINWSNLSKPQAQTAVVFNGIDAILNKLHTTDKACRDYKQQLSADQSTPNAQTHNRSYFDRLKSCLDDLQLYPYLHSQTPLARRILAKHAESPLLSHTALTFSVVSGQMAPSSFAQVDVRLVPSALNFLENANPIKGADAALSELQNVWSKRLAVQQEEYEQALSDAVAMRSRIEAEILQKREELARRQDECDRQIKEHDKKVADIEAHYREHLLLRAPAEYWQTKYIGHKKAAFWFFVLMTVIVVIVVGGSYALTPWILEQVRELKYINGGSGWVGEIALVSVPALAAFWLLRAVSRLFVQQTQRTGDALERNTMVKTYLALLTEPNHKVEAAERLVILQALFRPGPGDAPESEGAAGMLDALGKLSK